MNEHFIAMILFFVGLHIDHIISVSKDGKTIENILQVLCDKCNKKKKR